MHTFMLTTNFSWLLINNIHIEWSAHQITGTNNFQFCVPADQFRKQVTTNLHHRDQRAEAWLLSDKQLQPEIRL